MLSHKSCWALFYPFVLSLSKYERIEQSAATNPPFTLRQACTELVEVLRACPVLDTGANGWTHTE